MGSAPIGYVREQFREQSLVGTVKANREFLVTISSPSIAPFEP